AAAARLAAAASARPAPARVPGRHSLPLVRQRPHADPVITYLRLVFGTLCVLAPGWALARAFAQGGVAALLAWTLAAVGVAWAVVFAVHHSIHLAVAVLAAILVGALVARRFT